MAVEKQTIGRPAPERLDFGGWAFSPRQPALEPLERCLQALPERQAVAVHGCVDRLLQRVASHQELAPVWGARAGLLGTVGPKGSKVDFCPEVGVALHLQSPKLGLFPRNKIFKEAARLEAGIPGGGAAWQFHWSYFSGQKTLSELRPDLDLLAGSEREAIVRSMRLYQVSAWRILYDSILATGPESSEVFIPALFTVNWHSFRAILSEAAAQRPAAEGDEESLGHLKRFRCELGTVEHSAAGHWHLRRGQHDAAVARYAAALEAWPDSRAWIAHKLADIIKHDEQLAGAARAAASSLRDWPVAAEMEEVVENRVVGMKRRNLPAGRSK